MKINSTIGGRITFVILLAISISLGVFTFAIQSAYSRSATRMIDRNVAALADVIGQNSSAALDFNDQIAADSVLASLIVDLPIASACLYDSKEALFSHFRRDASSVTCSQTSSIQLPTNQQFRVFDRPLYHLGERIGSIRLIASTKEARDQERSMLLLSVQVAFISLGIGVLGGWILQRWISRPVVDLSSAMETVTAQNTFDVQVPIQGAREIAKLANGFNRMLTELDNRGRQLLEQSRTDPLTGLPNRRLFTERLAQELAVTERQSKMLAVLYIDLDGFKLVNDSFGHKMGDNVLNEVALRLQHRLRATDTLARLGGDEFSIILPNIEDRVDAGFVADTIIQALKEPFLLDGLEVAVGASIGIATHAGKLTDVTDLLREADTAMYAAKNGGKNRAVYYSSELDQMTREKLTIENELRTAIRDGKIKVHYQPEFDSGSGKLVRFEALARWTHPHLGMIPPDKFIPIAEESGLIHALGEMVLEKACRDCLEWQTLSERPVQVAVNVSALQFNAENIVEDIQGVLERTGLEPCLLQLELTESVMVGSLQSSAAKMCRLRDLGISLAIDDFGTGYSCLSYLPGLPFTALKIDRAFVRNLTPGSDSFELVRSMVDMAHRMNMRVIVEGVETLAQQRVMREMGADEMQGYLLGKPSADPIQHLKNHVANGEVEATCGVASHC